MRKANDLIIAADRAKAQTICDAVTAEWPFESFRPNREGIKVRVWKFLAQHEERQWYWDFGDPNWNVAIDAAIEKWERDMPTGGEE